MGTHAAIKTNHISLIDMGTLQTFLTFLPSAPLLMVKRNSLQFLYVMIYIITNSPLPTFGTSNPGGNNGNYYICFTKIH